MDASFLLGLVKPHVAGVHIDSASFRLHYHWTTSFCLFCSALITASYFKGGAIQCHGGDDFYNTYCWISSTYTINTTSYFDVGFYGDSGSTYSGIGTYIPELHEKKFHSFYQWVPYILFFQGCLFYMPHQLWKLMEGKQLENLLQGLNRFSITGESFEKKKENIVTFIRKSSRFNGQYGFGYFFVEILNLINVAGQMFLLDKFFGGMFLHLGTKILSLAMEDDEARFDPLIERFPRQAKCDYFNFGPSGSNQVKDFLCILPQNLLNEKIFLVMWVWFIVVACVTTAELTIRVLIFSLHSVRLKLLERHGSLSSDPGGEVDSFVRSLCLGDFFLLLAIGRNLSAPCFQSILKDLVWDPSGGKVLPPSAPLVEEPLAAGSDLEGFHTLRKRLMEEVDTQYGYDAVKEE